MVTDITGAPIWTADHLPFGETVSETGTANDPLLRYPGQWAVPSAEELNLPTLYYNTYRWYRPQWGRYSQADPLGLRGGGSLYSYANQNPTLFFDPFGLHPIGPEGCRKSSDREYMFTNTETLRSRGEWSFVRWWGLSFGELDTSVCWCRFKRIGTIRLQQDVKEYRREIVCDPCYHGGWVFELKLGKPYLDRLRFAGDEYKDVRSRFDGRSCACQEVWNQLP